MLLRNTAIWAVTSIAGSLFFANTLYGEIIADLRQNFQAASIGQTSTSINGGLGIFDTAGTGKWNYLQANSGGGGASLLTYHASPGNSGLPAYAGSVGGSESGFAMPALSINHVFGDGVTPPANNLNVHTGNENPSEVIARWTAGQSGLMNIAATVQDVPPSGDGVAYVVRRNGVDITPGVLSGTAGRIDGTNLFINVNAGDNIDLVVGANGGFGGDESHVAMRVSQPTGTLVANLAGDYNESGLPISATGNGTWQYFASNNVNINATLSEVPLSVKTIGSPGTTGYGANGLYNMGAVNNGIIFPGDGETPLAAELSIHPGNNSSGLEYTVLRWTAGAGEAGIANIVGNVRNLVPAGDSVDFHILVDGVSVYDVNGAAGLLPMSFFDISTPISIGSTVDFVLGNGAADFEGDESILAAFISVQAVPEPVSLATWGVLFIGLSLYGFRQYTSRRGA